jgi:hypothetical protein
LGAETFRLYAETQTPFGICQLPKFQTIAKIPNHCRITIGQSVSRDVIQIQKKRKFSCRSLNSGQNGEFGISATIWDFGNGILTTIWDLGFGIWDLGFGISAYSI